VQRSGVWLHPSNLQGGDVYGAFKAADLTRRLQPENLLLLNDLWILKNYAPTLSAFGTSPRVLAYVPLDGSIVDPQILAPLGFIDRLVVYTDFARSQVAAAGRALAARTPGSLPLDPDVLPHGVDVETFRPLGGKDIGPQCAARLEAKRALFPDLPSPESSFVVLNANRPQPRKRIDLTVRGFAAFAQGKPSNVRLHLHHAIISPRERRDIERLAGECGVAERLRISPGDGAPVDDSGLNRLYNACDVGLNTSMGEGWGLVSFEHAATGAAQVVPRHSACAELWRDSAEQVAAGPETVPPFSPFGMREVSWEGVAAALERLYRDRGYLQRMSAAAFDNAVRPAYRWHRVADDWQRLFESGRLAASGTTADAPRLSLPTP
jgi:glycosyltransferase involved in cell wall biosynthesis